ncbi:2Fe-2S iron-sulfur cluster binding domain-containing protein [Natrinema soli]|uniref:2Fe-2S iron-sulfur cluster-binding protein n=1 Tax=Natrinema soli TaxID=1930624 RepID=A0ABD5SJH8_9EURY|nr:2Fe-2S iron-sulfur cluster binding domain-containing protein [Natrinema soli]
MDIELPAVGPGVEENTDTAEDSPPAELEYLNYRAVVKNGWSVEDHDLFEKAAAAELSERDHGTVEIDRNETLLRSAEANDLKWGSQCRSGTCNVCTAVLKSGEAKMDMNLALSDEEVEVRDLRLTCVAKPNSDTLQIVFNAAPEANGNPGSGL